LVLFSISAVAQQTVTTGGGTTNAVPKFTGVSSVGNSAITDLGGNVGIGTLTPDKLFDVEKTITDDLVQWGPTTWTSAQTGIRIKVNPVNDQTSGGLLLGFVPIVQVPASNTKHIADIAGAEAASENYGSEKVDEMYGSINWTYHGGSGTVGTMRPAVNWAEVDTGHVDTLSLAENEGWIYGGSVDNFYGIYIDPENIHGAVTNRYGVYMPPFVGTATNDFGIYQSGIAQKNYFAGNVGIGTYTPTAKLELNGNLKLTSGSGATVTFADGTVQSTAWTGALCGGDYAESVGVAGDRESYAPGDLLVIDDTNPGGFLKSVEPYSTAVAGVYSTKPGALGRRQTTPKDPNEIPMAVIGIVPVKVSAENGPIHPRDILVSSSKPGYAMKGTDRSRMLGAIVGKALGSLDSGTGVIEVLVTLQ